VVASKEDEARHERNESLPHVARLTLVGGIVVLGVTAATLALWEGRTVVLLLFLAYTLGAAMRPGVDRLARRGVPRALALVGHFALFLGLAVLLLWLVVPVAFDQTQQALADVPRHDQTDQGLLYSVREQVLSSLESKLTEVSEPDTAISTLVGTLAALAGIAFTIAAAAYWVIERDRLVKFVLAVVPHGKRATIRDTWLLIDLKLGAAEPGVCFRLGASGYRVPARREGSAVTESSAARIRSGFWCPSVWYGLRSASRLALVLQNL
jgi:predicted PurR-regulated permease PerM